MLYINPTINQKNTQPEELGCHIGDTVRLTGAIYKIRNMSGFAFVILRTRRILVQCIYSPQFSDFPLESLKEEACVILTGQVVAEERSRTGYELHIRQVKLLASPAEELPVAIHNKTLEASLDTVLDYRPLTLRNEKERAIFKLQEGICRGFREFFYRENFTEIHSPKIVYAGAEGGANVFPLDYFDKKAYLAQSPQTYKQMMVAVFERVYEIAAVYRAEKHDTSRHLNEYISVDFEMGYIESFTELMQMEMQMLIDTLDYLQRFYERELALLKVSVPEIKQIPVIRFHEAKQAVSEVYHREITDWNDFEPEEEKLLSEWIKKQTGSDFVFVTHYPSKKRPFYAMDDPENPELTLSFDLLFRGLEITTGGQRIHDYKEQLNKLKSRGMHPEAFESYLMLHKYAVPPHGGLGLGLERFTARLLGLNNVRYASLFPRDLKRLTP